ncbi:angiomotin-like protein 1 [Esox lucius]|uniref:Angiomotin C-terminal domain-containing protein n=1 Tax=Esox lucius TaxID=8010 RepID=A0A3P8Y1T8_ESOLU|nr:angiomotin-like protein 1 [Esox lucius]XP_010892804.2 angiomotin-like protein 1 [Esox lucius]
MESHETNDELDSTTRRKAGPESGENWIPEDVAQWLDHIGISHEANGGLPLYHHFTGAFALDDRVFCPPETVSVTLNNDPISLTTQIPSLSTQPTSTLARETGHAALVFASYPSVSAMQREREEGASVLSSTILEQPGGGAGRPLNDNAMQPSPTPGSADLNAPSTSDSQLPPYAIPLPHPPLLHPQFLQLRWARQEPQGQEQQADGSSLEKHGPFPPQPSLQPSLEELPSYEQAKAQTQGLGPLHNQPCYTQEDQESLPSPPCTPDSQSAWTSLGPYRTSETSSPNPNTDLSPSPSPPLSPQQIFMCGADEQDGLSTWGEVGNGDSALREMKKSHSLSQKSIQFSIEANGTSNVPWNNPSSSYLLNRSPHTGPGDPRGPPPEYPFNPCQPPPSSPLGKPHPHLLDPGPLFSNASSDWCPSQPTRAESNPPPECHSRPPHPERLGGPSVQLHSPTPSHTLFSQPQTSTPLLPNIQTQTSTLFSQPQTSATLLPNIQTQTSTLFSQPQLQQVGAGPSVMVQQMVQLLCKENQTLRQELQTHMEKASKLHWLEAELQRISEDYNWLMNSSSKREGLDRTMRCKLEGEIRRLTVFNRDLRDRLETANHQLACCKPDGENGHAAELRDGLIEKERLEQEVEEQRGRAERLESALSSAQQRAQHLEEELRVKSVYAARVEGLQHALVQLQTACEKREQLERRLRTRLERELHLMRTQQGACGGGCGTMGKGVCVGEGSAPALRELLRQREERVLALEADSTRWEQKYLQENAMRHFTMETAATAGTYRDNLVVHSRSGSYSEMTSRRLWQEDDTQQSSRHCNDMEHRIRDLYAQLIEKDALIKVLQQRNSRRDLSTLRPASSTPSISLATGLHSRQASQTEERKEGRSFLPSLPLLSSLSSSSLPRSALSLPSTHSFSPALPHSAVLSHSSSTLPYSYSSSVSQSSTLPLSSSFPLSTISPSLHLSSSIPLSSSLPSTPLLSSHSKTGSRDCSTQTEKVSESHKVLPLPSRAWLELVKTQRTDKTRTQPSHMNLPDTDIVEILI